MIERKALSDEIANAIGNGLSRAIRKPRSLRDEHLSALLDNQERAVLLAVRVRAGDAVGAYHRPDYDGFGLEVSIDACEVVDSCSAEIAVRDEARANGANGMREPKAYGMRETWTRRMEEG